MTPWTDREIARFTFRAALFRRRGLPPAAADRTAERLVERDRDRDERRLCIECAHRQQSRTCFLGLPMTPSDLLARCPSFEFQKP